MKGAAEGRCCGYSRGTNVRKDPALTGGNTTFQTSIPGSDSLIHIGNLGGSDEMGR